MSFPGKGPGYEFSWKHTDLLWEDVRRLFGNEVALEEPQTVPSRQPKHPPRCMGSGHPGVCSPCNDLRPKPTPSKAPDSAAFLKALRPLLETQAPGSPHCFPEEPCSTHGSPPASQDKHLLDFRLLGAQGGLGPGAARRKGFAAGQEISFPASGIGLKHPAKANTIAGGPVAAGQTQPGAETQGDVPRSAPVDYSGGVPTDLPMPRGYPHRRGSTPVLSPCC